MLKIVDEKEFKLFINFSNVSFISITKDFNSKTTDLLHKVTIQFTEGEPYVYYTSSIENASSELLKLFSEKQRVIHT